MEANRSEIPLPPDSQEEWFYIDRGERIGPRSRDVMIQLLQQRELQSDSLVWKKGLSDWTPLGSTTLIEEITVPPPITGKAINNTLVWWIAFVPLLGLLIENIVMGIQQRQLDYMGTSIAYWVVYIALSAADQKKLDKSGHETTSLGWTLLIPIYLFVRAKKLRQTPSYAIVWCVCVLGVIAIPNQILDNAPFVTNQNTISFVRDGTFNSHPEMTVGQVAKKVLNNPKWESFVADEDGKEYVNLTGTSIANGDKILMQFVINGDKTFNVYTLVINDQPQGVLEISSFVEGMFSTVT